MGNCFMQCHCNKKDQYVLLVSYIFINFTLYYSYKHCNQKCIFRFITELVFLCWQCTHDNCLCFVVCFVLHSLVFQKLFYIFVIHGKWVTWWRFDMEDTNHVGVVVYIFISGSVFHWLVFEQQEIQIYCNVSASCTAVSYNTTPKENVNTNTWTAALW